MDMNSIHNFLSTTLSELAIKILAAIAFWFVGRWMIGRVITVVQAGMNRNHVDPTLTKYLGSIVAVALNIALVLGILGYFGIQTTSFAAMLAGAGVAIGAAWSGMLGNFAAGAFMLILRPFKVGTSCRSAAWWAPCMNWACLALPSSRPTTCIRWSAMARFLATRC